MSDLNAAQRENLKNQILKMRLDAKYRSSLEKIPLERLVEKHKSKRLKIIKHMEKRRDLMFLAILQYIQTHLSREEFLSIQIEVYAMCNKIAMQRCLPVDKIAHLVVLHEAFL